MINSFQLVPLGSHPVADNPSVSKTSKAENVEDRRDFDVRSHLLAILEAFLFIAPGPVTPNQLSAAINLPLPEVERGLNELEALYVQECHKCGLRLQRFAGQIQLTTAPEIAPFIERFMAIDISSHLSRASLETLAIVMYKQPVTRPQIDAVRGVNSDAVLKSLLIKGMVQEIGRAETPGRPILYSITTECLQSFGLSSLSQLPPLELGQEIRSE